VLSPEEKQTLLNIARQAIAGKLNIQHDEVRAGRSAALSRPSGAFVTLHRSGRLRGCIGYVRAIRPLAEAVEELAEKAALEDPRFSPLRRQEFEGIQIEISVLGPIVPMRFPDEIEIGKHGILLEYGYASGLLLPQVATEWGWNREQFLESTAEKAGLPVSVLQDPKVKISLFTAEVFSESSSHRIREST
jgi:AmmeMemoRadiSam system protein A